MRNATASSGVGVQVEVRIRDDLPSAVRTTYELACHRADVDRTEAEREELGRSLQALISAADGENMTDRIAAAVDIREWVDVHYRVTRPDGSAGRWTPRTGLSSGERRLVVLAPMLAAMAAAYDKYGQAGCRLAALDEIPSEVDERGREGLARYIAELDLDLVCTSYLWDGAPGAWDGVDAHDLEAAPTEQWSPSPCWYAATIRCPAIRRDYDQLHYLRGCMHRRRPRTAEEPCTAVGLGATRAADRRGDANLTVGAITVTAPEEPAERAAAIGLLGDRPLAPGQQRRIDLAVLTGRLQVRGPYLTPGAAAAHALGRPLATSARARAERAAARSMIEATLADALAQHSDEANWALPGINSAWPYLLRSGWSARMLIVNDSALLVQTAVTVIAHLPPRGNRLDRRQLASDHAHNPHALDEGTILAGLVLALTTAAGATSTAQRTRDA